MRAPWAPSEGRRKKMPDHAAAAASSSLWTTLIFLLGPAAIPAIAVAALGYFKDRNKTAPQQSTLGLVAIYADREALQDLSRVGKALIESIDTHAHTLREAVEDMKEKSDAIEKELWKLRSQLRQQKGRR